MGRQQLHEHDSRTRSQSHTKHPRHKRSFDDYEDETEFDGLIRRMPSGEYKVPIPEAEVGDEHVPWFSWRLFLAYTGPGWLMSVAYLDPGNIESDLQAGGYSGYQLLWVLLWSTLLGLLMQVLAARLGTVSGHNLAENCRHFYSSAEIRILWLMTQVAIIGSDIQEIVGSAVAFRVLFGIPLWTGCLITGLDTLTFLAIHVAGVRKLEAVFGMLILTMCVCFFATFGSDPPNASHMARGLFVPTVSERSVVQAVSTVGAVVMPHNIFLHSALVLSRDVDRTRPNKIVEANKYFALEAALALLVSLLINCAIVSVFAHGFYSDVCASHTSPLMLASGTVVHPPFACVPARHGAGPIDMDNSPSPLACVTATELAGTCKPIGLQGAARALETTLGQSARVLWAVGLLAAGQSSTMTGTFAGQFVMEGFLHMEVPNWARVMITRTISLVPATLVALLANSDSLAADRLDEWLNVLQSVQLPFAVLPLLHFTGSKDVMGEFRNGRTLSVLGWGSGVAIVSINVYLVFKRVMDAGASAEAESSAVSKWIFSLGMTVLSSLYFYMIWRIVRVDVTSAARHLGNTWSRWRGTPLLADDNDDGINDCDRSYDTKKSILPKLPTLWTAETKSSGTLLQFDEDEAHAQTDHRRRGAGYGSFRN